MGIIGWLIAIVILLIIFWKKGTVWLYAILVLLCIALWVEWFNQDIDLGKFLETGNYKESRVESVQDGKWNSVRLITGTCATKDFDLDCKDFATQTDAQKKYDQCANQIKENNPNITNINAFDIYGLDKNKNGIVCEHLPKTAK